MGVGGPAPGRCICESPGGISNHFLLGRLPTFTHHEGGCLPLALLDRSSSTITGDPWVLQSRTKLEAYVMLVVCDLTLLSLGTLV